MLCRCAVKGDSIVGAWGRGRVRELREDEKK
jgi:hypothetical protein